MLKSDNWQMPSVPVRILIGWPLLLVLFLAALSGLGACSHIPMTASGVTSPSAKTVCLAFQPIRWSQFDTLETQKQARAHNAAGRSMCGWKP